MGVSKDASPLLQCGSAQNLGDLRGQFLGAEGSLHLGFVTAIVETRHVGEAGDADETGHSLDRQIHRQIVAIRAGQPVSGAGRIDRLRIDGVQHLEPDTEPVHNPRREILQQHIGLRGHLEEQSIPALILQVERNRAFVGSEGSCSGFFGARRRSGSPCGGSINANSTISLSAPTSGQYAGVAAWFGDSNTVTRNGGNSSSFSGTI